MVSILIPTYNYDVMPLVRSLAENRGKVPFEMEIIIRDDASGRPSTNLEQLKAFTWVAYRANSENKGRTATRNALAKEAKYDNLLFLDADVLPKYPDFLNRFQWETESWDLQFGGIEYEEEPPASEYMLRWKYGKRREQLSVDKRKLMPYKSVNSGCLLIRKDVFLKLNKQMTVPRYGMDIYFKELLINFEVNVLHIDNPVYHNGLETSEEFLKKSLEAVATTAELESKGLLKLQVRPLQKAYRLIKNLGLRGFYGWFLSSFKNTMEKNFLSKRPNLFWFDLYRLNYYIQLKRSNA